MERQGHGWWPYLAPYGLFLVLADLGSRFPDAWQPWVWLVRVLVPGALLIGFARRGGYPELRGYRLEWLSLADVGVGLAIAGLWLAPYLLIAELPRPELGTGFDAGILGVGREPAALAVRLLGFAAFTPFIEELFVRSFLIRYIDVFKSGADFRQHPMARYAARSFWFTVAWFTLTHAPWEWWVALPTGILLNLWLYRRGHLGAPILAHAVANGSIAVAALVEPEALGIFL